MSTKEKKEGKFKLINYRFFTALLAFCIAGILLAYFGYRYSVIDLIVIILSGTAIIAVLLVYKRKGLQAIVMLTCFALFYFATVGLLYTKINNDTSYSSDYLEVRISFVSASGEKVRCSFESGEAELTVGELDGYTLREGERLLLENARVSPTKIVNGGMIDSYAISQLADYEIYADSIYEIREFSPTLAEMMRLGVKSATEGMEPQARGVLLALLTGDKYGIDSEIYESFKVSGIAHVLAVSGLHVVFLYSAVELLLKKIKVRKRVRVALSAPVLLLFCATCSFSPSVVRASFMTLLHSVVPAVSKKRYDSLSTMSLSAIIVLAFNPLDVIDYGFLLSYSSVLGIISFAPKFRDLLCRLPAFLRESLSVSASVSLTTFPILSMLFGELSLLSPITNIIVIPLLGAFYGLMFAVVLVVIAFPALAFLLNGCAVIVGAVSAVAVFISAIPFASVAVSVPLWFTLCYYGCGFVISDYVFLRREYKLASGAMIVTSLVLLFVVI